MLWALYDAPGVPAHCLGVLMGLAERADENGRGAYPSTETLSALARKSKRQAQSDIDRLAELGLIRLGDQSITAHLRANYRPVVWDIAMERKRVSATSGVQPTAPLGVQPTSPLTSSRGEAHCTPRGVKPTAPLRNPDLQERGTPDVSAGQQGRSTAQPGVKPASPETSLNHKDSPTESPAIGGAGGVLFGDDPPAKPATRRKPRNRTPEHPRFAEWYQAFPLHKARADASDAYSRAVNSGADPDALLAAAINYQRDERVIRGYTKYPATWLNKECWLDEPELIPSANGHRENIPQVSYSEEEYRSGW